MFYLVILHNNPTGQLKTEKHFRKYLMGCSPNALKLVEEQKCAITAFHVKASTRRRLHRFPLRMFGHNIAASKFPFPSKIVKFGLWSFDFCFPLCDGLSRKSFMAPLPSLFYLLFIQDTLTTRTAKAKIRNVKNDHDDNNKSYRSRQHPCLSLSVTTSDFQTVHIYNLSLD